MRVEVDKRKIVRDLAIARFAKCVEKYLYDTHWPTIATMCGVIDLLDQPKHERVRKAQLFGDSDYATAISIFLREIFDLDEQVGLAVINEIIQQEEVSQEAKNEINQILPMFGNKSTDAKSW